MNLQPVHEAHFIRNFPLYSEVLMVDWTVHEFSAYVGCPYVKIVLTEHRFNFTTSVGTAYGGQLSVY
ncbi:hypothetical protein PHET_07660 [Paragonimus heterotremus]|uniref:Uncharacterized protein n=1 Tax=Paragonimus heterotremus TaxID=100268 RepID=A0A8J4SI37_9TREM|nr:hypothetical protein PHET_07660 [Paragonimus heterotremus]